MKGDAATTEPIGQFAPLAFSAADMAPETSAAAPNTVELRRKVLRFIGERNRRNLDRKIEDRKMRRSEGGFASTFLRSTPSKDISED